MPKQVNILSLTLINSVQSPKLHFWQVNDDNDEIITAHSAVNRPM